MRQGVCPRGQGVLQWRMRIAAVAAATPAVYCNKVSTRVVHVLGKLANERRLAHARRSGREENDIGWTDT